MKHPPCTDHETAADRAAPGAQAALAHPQKQAMQGLMTQQTLNKLGREEESTQLKI